MAEISIINQSKLENTSRIDAEYYQTKFLAIENAIYKTRSYKLWKHIKGKFITGPFGSEFIVENYIENGRFRYVRGRDIKEFLVLDDDNAYISEGDFTRLKKYSLKSGDILISVVGTLGNAAMVDEKTIPAIFSCKSTLYRSESLDPFYIIAYLNSKYGHSFFERKVRGAVQTGLNIDDLKSTPIFIPDQNIEKHISKTVKEAKNSWDLSKKYYSEAEELLLNELGFSEYTPNYRLNYLSKLSEAIAANRLDAEYFQPIYNEMIDTVRKNAKLEKLSHYLSNFQKGTEIGSEQYQLYGKPFIRVSNMSRSGIVERDQKFMDEELYNRLKDNYEPRLGEFLLTKDATPGIAYVIKEPVEGIISSGIMKLLIDENKINKEYLALCINSIIGILQVERNCGGSVISHWRPEQIRDLLVPILSDKDQERIGSILIKSHEARKRAKQLLEEAKRKVEIEIEKKSN